MVLRTVQISGTSSMEPKELTQIWMPVISTCPKPAFGKVQRMKFRLSSQWFQVEDFKYAWLITYNTLVHIRILQCWTRSSSTRACRSFASDYEQNESRRRRQLGRLRLRGKVGANRALMPVNIGAGVCVATVSTPDHLSARIHGVHSYTMPWFRSVTLLVRRCA